MAPSVAARDSLRQKKRPIGLRYFLLPENSSSGRGSLPLWVRCNAQTEQGYTPECWLRQQEDALSEKCLGGTLKASYLEQAIQLLRKFFRGCGKDANARRSMFSTGIQCVRNI